MSQVSATFLSVDIETMTLQKLYLQQSIASIIHSLKFEVIYVKLVQAFNILNNLFLPLSKVW